MAETVILAETTYEGFVNGQLNISPAPFALVEGETYRVVWDGVEHECECVLLDGFPTITDADNLDAPTKASFMMAYVPADGVDFVTDVLSILAIDLTSDTMWDTVNTSHTVAVYQGAAEETPDKEYRIWGSTLKGIADAIRSKDGTSGEIAVSDMAAKISAISGGGGDSNDVRYVTFLSEDGTVEYGKKAVAVGDDCADPIARGLFDTPAKESTAQYNYTFAGWSTEAGGGLNEDALKSVTEDRVVYANYIAAVIYYTIRYYDGDTLLKSESLAYGATPSYVPAKSGYTFLGWSPEAVAVTGDATYSAQWEERITFANGSWAQIAGISESGQAAEYFAVGDTKEITWGGNTYTCVILGLDHDDLADGSGKAGMTIGVLTAHPTAIKVFTSSYATGYSVWGNSKNDLYITIKGFQSEVDLADIVAVAKSVKKHSYRYIDQTVVATTDTFFAFSYEEMCGIESLCGDTGSQYAYFTADTELAMQALRKVMSAGTSTYVDYWLRDSRSDYSNGSGNFYWPYIANTGGTNTQGYGKYDSKYVVFGFCV